MHCHCIDNPHRPISERTIVRAAIISPVEGWAGRSGFESPDNSLSRLQIIQSEKNDPKGAHVEGEANVQPRGTSPKGHQTPSASLFELGWGTVHQCHHQLRLGVLSSQASQMVRWGVVGLGIRRGRGIGPGSPDGIWEISSYPYTYHDSDSASSIRNPTRRNPPSTPLRISGPPS